MLSKLSRLIKVASQPRANGITPITGTKSGGTAITNLAGSGFLTGAKVYIDDRLCTSIVVVTSIRITCITPSNSGTGTKKVTVANPDGEVSTVPNGFTYT